MRIAVFGAGTLGTVVATCLAETGHLVRLYDQDGLCRKALAEGRLSFHEPGMLELFQRNQKAQRLLLADGPASALQRAQLALICVGTKRQKDGASDPSTVYKAAEEIASDAKNPLIVVVKSAVPVGTSEKVAEICKGICSFPITVVSQPEFFKEGTAIDDFMRPDRVIVGTQDPAAQKVLADLLRPYLRTGNPLLFMDQRSAELCKLAADALLASRISFMNAMARLCDQVGGDIHWVRQGVGSDRRIGKGYLFAGAGYGGPRLSQDVRDLIQLGKEHGLPMEVLRAVDRINQEQKRLLPERVRERLGADLRGKKIALWGVAYKANTDDIREAPAVEVIQQLLLDGAKLQVYDPRALPRVRAIFKERLTYCQDPYAACQGADLLMILTDWNQFRQPDFARLKSLMKIPLLFDGRNLLDPNKAREQGFEYQGIGRR